MRHEITRQHEVPVSVSILKRPSAWDLVYAVAMALACLVSYAVMTELLNVAVEGHSDLVGGMWAAVSTAFVFRDSRQHSLAAGVGRLLATCVSFALCLPYLWFIAANTAGMGILLAAGTLVMVLLDRREDIITTAVTTIVVMVVAVLNPAEAWKQPLLRLFDTVVGIVIGVAGKWIASFAFYRARGEPIR
jgi:uncharacterized membrane protein YccC